MKLGRRAQRDAAIPAPQRMPPADIRIEGLTHIYHPGTPQARAALRDVSLTIPGGSCAAVVGVTGSGKSTLVQHLNGLLRPTEGRVLVGDLELGPRANPAVLRAVRRRVGLLFQFPEAQLFAPTVFEDVAYGPRQMRVPESAVRERVRSALRAVALEPDDALLDRSPFALSGGQRRRVALAGVLAMRPAVLVLDEPSAGLDAEARDELYARLADLRAGEGLTLVLVSHDMGEVAALAERVFVLAGGALRLSGTPSEVFPRVAELEAAGLLAPPLAQVVRLAAARGLPVGPYAERIASAGDAEALSRSLAGAAQALRDGHAPRETAREPGRAPDA